MDKILVLTFSLILVIGIIWWFFLKPKDEENAAIESNGTQVIEIMVDGGYSPRIISLKKDIPAKLIFFRKDPSSCLEQVIIPEFGVSQKLPLGKSFEINLTPNKTGEFIYTCGMQMFSGTVVVK